MSIPPELRARARDALLLSILEGQRREHPDHVATVVEPDGTELTAEDLEARIAERRRQREGGQR